MGYYDGNDTWRKVQFYANQFKDWMNKVYSYTQVPNLDPNTAYGVAPLPGIGKSAQAAEETGKVVKEAKSLVKRGRKKKFLPDENTKQLWQFTGDYKIIDGKKIPIRKNVTPQTRVEDSRGLAKALELPQPNTTYAKSNRGSGMQKVESVDTKELKSAVSEDYRRQQYLRQKMKENTPPKKK